jgi:NADH-quinone oxidoreductase subunit I
MTNVYEFSEYERGNLLYKFTTLNESEAAEKKSNYEKFQIEKEAQKAAAATAAAAKPKPEAPAQSGT